MRKWILLCMLFMLCLRLAAAADTALWLDAGRPSVAAQQAVALLADAASHGLEPSDYDAAALQRALAQAAQGLSPQAAEALAQALTPAMQRFLGDLHDGRIDPRRIHHDFGLARRAPFDAAAALRDMTPEAAVQAAVPQLPQYAQLREQLAHYRTLAGDAAWAQPLPPLPAARRGAPKLEPGQDWAGVPRLAGRLAALGDLPSDARRPARYEGELVDALQRFQQRHGLASDGVIGAATLAQLQVAPAARARQIELMLERLRWTPLLQAQRMVAVNIPEFVLRAYEVQPGRIQVQREMRVIVGNAYRSRTPLLEKDMRSIEFSPYWNVPPSIARSETVPRLRRDPGYLAREGFEFVAADGQVHTTPSPQALDAVLAGQWRIRQRPGERNALGDIKFVLPNSENIYLHHTPSTQLFERTRRDFSHGCIRVEHPVALAAFVLQGMPGWDEARIRAAMSAGRPGTLRLAQPVPVLITYGTALVKGGRIHFFEDIYGLDRVLDDALRRRPPRPPIIARQPN
ncbi:MAG TPA: L,D-transpeptidase family protein [Rubrivivax sp.]|nr:L,D-transpeptidase family protein [Rubrivivax sp.]HPO18208.1 L,D-transpeptidase family protein [Rubrivivax sp.]